MEAWRCLDISLSEITELKKRLAFLVFKWHCRQCYNIPSVNKWLNVKGEIFEIELEISETTKKLRVLVIS